MPWLRKAPRKKWLRKNRSKSHFLRSAVGIKDQVFNVSEMFHKRNGRPYRIEKER